MLNNTISNQDLYSLMDVMLRPRKGELNRTPQLALPIDVFEKDGLLSVRAPMPGVAPENVEISVEDNLLTISGENHSSYEDKESRIYRRENVYGQFRRTVRLSEEFDATKAVATFAHGVVTVSIPRSVTAKPKIVKIPVTAAIDENTSVAFSNPAVTDNSVETGETEAKSKKAKA